METLDHFLSEIDAYHYLIRFSSEIGQDKVDFLDLSLFKDHRFRDHNILDPLFPFYPSPTLPTLSNAHFKLHHIRTIVYRTNSSLSLYHSSPLPYCFGPRSSLDIPRQQPLNVLRKSQRTSAGKNIEKRVHETNYQVEK